MYDLEVLYDLYWIIWDYMGLYMIYLGLYSDGLKPMTYGTIFWGMNIQKSQHQRIYAANIYKSQS